MGVANESSAAWGIAKKASGLGAELAFTYQMPAFEKRLVPLADSIGADILIPCDVSEENASKIAVEQLSKHWTEIDFVVHAVGFSDKQQLRGAYYNTTRDNFKQTMLISTFSFTELAQASSMMMPKARCLSVVTLRLRPCS